MTRSTKGLIVLVTLLLVPFAAPQSASLKESKTEVHSTVVFLVRHAEKVDSSRDPFLSEAGKKRARDLARVLRDAKVENIHSTDFIRTRDTAAPLASVLGLKVESYDPRDLGGFASRLRNSGGRHLVVGHSNTTPALVKLLGGDPVSPIEEKEDYDRLYVVTFGASSEVSSVLMRYGD